MTPAPLLPALVMGLQAFSGLVWIMLVSHYSASTVRVLRGRAINWDGAGCWAFALGVTQVGFVARWLILGRSDTSAMNALSLEIWSTLYALNGSVAVGILYTWRDTDYPRALKRARKGLFMWIALAVLCVGAAWLFI